MKESMLKKATAEVIEDLMSMKASDGVISKFN